MLLKRLELQGFKSFADKTVLSFEHGVTAVVGPNGSGKSNIADAVRWVMGEQSAKSLRGANMQDVIFAGAESRKPLNYAEVSLVLDNSEHVFDLDYEEITVTRRVFRSGETAYQINRANCRLRDIHELFMDTGLGRDGYSIIGQGNVSRILSTKAEDRRSFFEEAAGVSKYKYRRDEAARKLVSVEENLTRIQDITGELETQLEPLKRQSEKARKYVTLYEEFKTLDVKMTVVNLARNKSAATDAERLYESVAGELEDIRRQESESETKIEELYNKSRHADELQAEKHKELAENKTRSMQAENSAAIAKNNIKNNNARIAKIAEECAAEQKKSADILAEIDGLEQEKADKAREIPEIQAGLENIRGAIRESEDKCAAIYARSEQYKSDIISRMNDITAERARTEGTERLRQSFIERRTAIEAELAAFGENEAELKDKLAENEAALKTAAEKRDKTRVRVEDYAKRKEAAEQKRDEARTKYNELRVEYNSRESRKRILEDMENSYEGYPKSVKAVLTADELKSCTIYGTVANLIRTDRKYITAVETALGAAMQNIVVASEDDAKAAIAYLKRTHAGRAVFLPLTSVKGRTLDEKRRAEKCAGYIGVAADLINFDKRYDGVIRSLLGRVVIVDNIDNGVNMAREFGYRFRIVTLDGDVLNSGGSLAGGSVAKSTGVLSRAAEIDDLAAEMSRISKEGRRTKAIIEETEHELESITTAAEAQAMLLREYEDTVLKAQSAAEHLRQSLETGGGEAQSRAAELEEINATLSSTGDDIAEGINRIRAIEAEIAALKEKAHECEEEHAEAVANKDELSETLTSETMRLADMVKDADVLAKSIDDKRANIAAIEAGIKASGEESERLRADNAEQDKAIAAAAELIAEIKAAEEHINNTIADIAHDKQNILNRLQELQASGKDMTDRIMILQRESAKIETRRAKLDMERESMINRLWDEYELTLSAASEQEGEIDDEKAASARLAELKSAMKSLGSVNMDSIEEYTSVKERYEFLSAQKADLEKSKDDLTKISESMAELMEEHFQTQIAVINDSFEQVFRDLFGGGHGRLYLSEPDNVLESGIEIEVQLPGKGLQNLNLYSGGEKSFIATALLFAILNVKPTPFCILDEIDAALDDVNVSRFATYLKNYSNDLQFIVITHRRGTMEAADVLYGVTMQEKGVSKLLSLQIDDVDEDMAN